MMDGNEVNEERRRIMELALSYYGDNLRKLIDNPELTPHQMEDLKNDLSRESLRSEQLRIEIHDNGVYRKTQYSHKPIIDYENDRVTIINALEIYLQDLKKLKETVRDRVVNLPNFEKSDKVIESCERFLKYLRERKTDPL